MRRAPLRLATAALAGALGSLFPAGPAHAGPAEARTRWKEAQALKRAPWRDRLRAFRAARAEAAPTDSLHARAAAAEARLLRDEGFPGVAAAAEALAASVGPRRDPDRLAQALAAARALDAEADAVGARAWLDDVVENGGGATPWLTAPALDLQSRLAEEARDGPALRRLVRRAEALVPRELGARLRLLDRLGLHLLDAADRAAAGRVLADERRLYAEAERARDDVARDAAKAWLDLRLPSRLGEADP